MAAHNRLKLEGQRFMRLVVTGSAGNHSNGESLWECQCDCGNTTTTTGNRLTSGNTKSCGCYHKIRTRSLFKKPPEETGLGRVFSTYKKSAREKGRDFELTKDQFGYLILEHCSYCGSVPVNKRNVHGHDFFYQGIDRVDNDKGYTLENCVPCCMICNKMKKAMSREEFLDHIGRIHENCNVIE